MSFKHVCIYTKILMLLLLLPGSLCLRDLHMIIPEAVERGKPVVIRFMYDLENEELYLVKWYRGDRELCRYAPGEVRPLKIFPIPGIDVDWERSDAKQLTIRAATRAVQGRYICEVSTNAPSFMTAQVYGFMYVVDLPMSDPELMLMKRSYEPGMKMKAECITYNSMPPANISFFINNEPAPSRYVWKRVAQGKNSSLWTASSTLQFVIQEHHFIKFKIREMPIFAGYCGIAPTEEEEELRELILGWMDDFLRIRCAATIYSIYYKINEQVADAESISTTISPTTMIQDTTIYSIQLISENSSSSNRKVVWAVSSITFIFIGLHMWR